MTNEKQDNNSNEIAWISYLDERNIRREAFVYIIKFYASIVKFKTQRSGSIITIPTSRILKIKQKGVKEDANLRSS